MCAKYRFVAGGIAVAWLLMMPAALADDDDDDPSANPSVSRDDASDDPTTPSPPVPPTPTPTPSPTLPPLTVDIGKVVCPARTVAVRVTNHSDSPQNYSVGANTTVVYKGALQPRQTRVTTIGMREGQSIPVWVIYAGRPIDTELRKAKCAKPKPKPKPTDPTTPPEPSSGLKASIGRVRCPGRTVRVTVTNNDDTPREYTILSNGTKIELDTAVPGERKTSSVPVRENVRTTIEVTADDSQIATASVRANCSVKPPPRDLPKTGSSAEAYAKGATGIGALIMGGILFGYAFLWPRGEHGNWGPVTRFRR